MEELRKIQCELHAPKNQINTFGKYQYRSVEDIMEAVKPLLSKYGCTLTISDEVSLIGDRYYVKATAVLMNSEGKSESATAYAREEESKKGMDAAQLTGATSSYARKYALNGLLAIDDNKDADALAKIAEAENMGQLVDVFNEQSRLNGGVVSPVVQSALSERKRQLKDKGQ